MKTTTIIAAWTSFLVNLSAMAWAIVQLIQAGQDKTGEEPFFMVTAIGFFFLAAISAAIADNFERGEEDADN